jgi:pimeloyl-ACP methyl ester carboxylesterase
LLTAPAGHNLPRAEAQGRAVAGAAQQRDGDVMKDGFAATSYGRVHYLHAGSGAPLILLHSNGCSAHEYREVLERLARDRWVIAWDMPGHGDSDPITRHHSVTDYARAVTDLMDILRIGKASVLGASIGGSICVALGARHAARVDRLIVVEAPARSPEEAEKDWPRAERNYGCATQTRDEVAQRIKRVSPEFLARWNIDRNKAGVKTMIDVMWALREYDVVYDMPKVAAKSLLIFGDRGPTIGKLPTFQERMPQARIEVMKECGHFPMNDAPEDFAVIVNTFLDEEAQRNGAARAAAAVSGAALS